MIDLIVDYEKFSQAFLKITTKDSKLIPLKLNQYQLRLHLLIDSLRRQNKPVRIIILKARQMGISTACSGYVYHQTSTNFYKRALLVAHDMESTTNLFDMVKRYYDFSPERIRPLKRYSNRRELVFENGDEKDRASNPGLLSSISIDTAGKDTVGRSGTIHTLHLSELAFWPNAATSLSSLLQAVPNQPGTTVLVESTANGIDGDGKVFYEMWQKAVKGLNDFTPFFIPWFDNDEYRLGPPLNIQLTDKEFELKGMYDLDDAQLYWRRWKISNDLGSDEKMFCQEFPSSADEAFIVSGRPVFDLGAVQKKIHSLSGIQVLNDNGVVRIYEEPSPNQVYTIGADTAEGLIDGDHSAAFIMGRDFKQYARIYGHMDTDRFSDCLVDVGRKYNKALIAPEINNMGYAVLSRIKALDYSNIYQRDEADTHEEKILRRLGWITTTKSKHLMIAEFIAAFRDDSIDIKDEELLREMLTLSYEPDGNINLNSKDLVVSVCIALQALKQTPHLINYKAYVPPEGTDKIIIPETLQQRLKRQVTKPDSYYE